MKNDIYFSDLIFLGNKPQRNVETFLDHGISCIELMMDGAYWDEFLHNKELIQNLRSYPVEYSLHSPCWDVNLASENSYLRKAAFEIGKDAITFAAEVNSSYIVIHPGFLNASVFNRENAQHRVKEMLAQLGQFAKRSGVKIAIENVGYQGNALFSLNEFVHLLDGFGDEIGYILDTGHAYLDGIDIVSAMSLMADKLLGMHLHDNDGLTDRHLPVGSGLIEWQPVWDYIKTMEDECNLVLEYNYNVSIDSLNSVEAIINLMRR